MHEDREARSQPRTGSRSSLDRGPALAAGSPSDLATFPEMGSALHPDLGVCGAQDLRPGKPQATQDPSWQEPLGGGFLDLVHMGSRPQVTWQGTGRGTS